LLQVPGSFDPQLIAGFFPSPVAGKVKVVGPHTLLIGDGDSFAKAAERMTAAGAPISHRDLEQSDIWIEGSAAILTQQSGQPIPPAFQGLKGFSVGLNLGESPEINLSLSASDEASAAGMLKIFQDGVEQLVQLNQTASAAAKPLILKQEGSKIRMHYVVPPELVAMAQQQAASGDLPAQLAPLLGSWGVGGFGGATTAKPPVGASRPEPPPQNGGKIKIFGLDDGPKELPAH
jgi:hypothetical protein